MVSVERPGDRSFVSHTLVGKIRCQQHLETAFTDAGPYRRHRQNHAEPGQKKLGRRPNRTCKMHQRIDDADWSLGMALAWITHRSEKCVSNIKTAKWAPTKEAIRDLLSALRSAKLIAHGIFGGGRIPHPLETAVWSTFEIVVKPTLFSGHVASSDVRHASRHRSEDGPTANPDSKCHRAGGQGQKIVARC
jgi:hypothetical protein